MTVTARARLVAERVLGDLAAAKSSQEATMIMLSSRPVAAALLCAEEEAWNAKQIRSPLSEPLPLPFPLPAEMVGAGTVPAAEG
jgi:hypothetical protein